MIFLRYKIRRERTGGFFFDNEKRCVSTLTEGEIQCLTAISNGNKLLHTLPVGLSEKDFFKNKEPNFSLIQPIINSKARMNNSWLVAPNRLYLELTRNCNLRCLMCYNNAIGPLPNELTGVQWKKLLDEMDRIAVFEARFTGGEPTLHPDFLEILDYAIAKGFYVSVATNGVWKKEMLKKICSRNIDDFIISVDGPKEINNYLREGGSFERTIETIKALKNAGMKKVRINTVLSKVNYLEIEELFQLCQKYELLLIDFIHPRPFGRGATVSAKRMTLTAKETLEFNLLVKELRLKYPEVLVVMDFDLLSNRELPLHPIVPRIKACPAGREFAFISPQGYVFPCGVAPVQDIGKMTEREKSLFVAGNILNSSFLEIWNNSPSWESFRDFNKCKPQKCHSCNFWGKKCFGTCPLGAYYMSGKLSGEDPYCYSHLISDGK